MKFVGKSKNSLVSLMLMVCYTSGFNMSASASQTYIKDNNYQLQQAELAQIETPPPSYSIDVSPEPTALPSINDDIEPNDPETIPTFVPSQETTPTPTPTVKPTTKPTAKPSVKPTAKPTPKPKVTPTPKPVIKKVVKPKIDKYSGQAIMIKEGKNTEKYVLKPSTMTISEYVVMKGDNLQTIAKKFNIRYRTLAKMNNATSPYLHIGDRVVVDKSVQPGSNVDGVVVNIPENRLYYFEKGKFKKSYPVSVGLPDPKWQTPIGNFKISEKVKAPVWMVPLSIQKEMAAKGQVVKKSVPAGPGNPLGNWWMGLSRSGVGIHSTNAPLSVGYSVSHGCIRMKPASAEEMFQKVQKNTPVRVIYQPVKLSIDDNKIYLQVYRDVYNRKINTTEYTKKMLKDFDLEKYVDWKKITPVIRYKRGVSALISK